MPTVTLDNEITRTVLIVSTSRFDGTCVIELEDHRSLSEVAKEFDGVSHIVYSDEHGQTEYNGYSKLTSIMYIFDHVIQVKLSKVGDTGV